MCFFDKTLKVRFKDNTKGILNSARKPKRLRKLKQLGLKM